MSGSGISRGHPLVALLAVLGGWIGGRVATWEAPVQAAAQAAAESSSGVDTGFVVDSRNGPQSLPGGEGGYGYTSGPPIDPGIMAPYQPGTINRVRRYFVDGQQVGPYFAPRLLEGRNGFKAYQSLAVDHLRSDYAASDDLPRFYAPEVAGRGEAAPSPAAGEPHARKLRRWSGDAWALLRRDEMGALASPGALPATYGGSQTGAVLRYHLAPTSSYRPKVYLRTTGTTGMLGETSAAIGLSGRPLPSFPVYAALEARVTDSAGRRRFQPAVMAVTELAPWPLPGALQGEAYVQAGYVAGRFATPFADGQMRVDRSILTAGKVQARIGAAIWGGIQKGASRLDAGPSASLAMPLGRGTSGRLAVDWRFRLAGEAVPESGPALTLSAGF